MLNRCAVPLVWMEMASLSEWSEGAANTRREPSIKKRDLSLKAAALAEDFFELLFAGDLTADDELAIDHQGGSRHDAEADNIE